MIVIKGKKVISLTIVIVSIILFAAACGRTYARYILTRNYEKNFSSFPFYFEATSNVDDVKMLLHHASIELTIKNNDEENFNLFNTSYTISLEDSSKFTISVTDDNKGILIGRQKKENKINVEFTPVSNENLNDIETINLLIKSTKPYEKVIKIPITIKQPTLVEGGRSDFRKVLYSDDTEGKPIEEYNRLYGGNNNNIQYDTDGSIILDEDNPVMVFEKSDFDYKEEYSVYITVKGDIDQCPKTETGEEDRWGPSTIFAMSGEQVNVIGNVVNRLCWFGYRKGCFQIYSYLGSTSPSDVNGEFYDPETFPGFLSKTMPRQYDNQIVNIQITANTNRKTNIYLNGELWTSYDSGNGTGEFFEATIGDLRALRGVKFIGNFYDISVYPRKLTEEEVKQNWEYARDKWNIQ